MERNNVATAGNKIIYVQQFLGIDFAVPNLQVTFSLYTFGANSKAIVT
jgi:hypothetical protein